MPGGCLSSSHAHARGRSHATRSPAPTARREQGERRRQLLPERAEMRTARLRMEGRA